MLTGNVNVVVVADGVVPVLFPIMIGVKLNAVGNVIVCAVADVFSYALKYATNFLYDVPWIGSDQTTEPDVVPDNVV
jgi:hypothetical protein